MLRLILLVAVLLTGVDTAYAAHIDDGPLPDVGRYLTGCWVSAEGTLAMGEGQVSVCFADGVIDTAWLDANGERFDARSGSYRIRNEQLVLTGPETTTWVFGRATIICDVGVLPHVRLGLFDCVGSGPLPDGTPAATEFLPEMRFNAQKEAAT